MENLFVIKINLFRPEIFGAVCQVANLTDADTSTKYFELKFYFSRSKLHYPVSISILYL